MASLFLDEVSLGMYDMMQNLYSLKLCSSREGIDMCLATSTTVYNLLMSKLNL